MGAPCGIYMNEVDESQLAPYMGMSHLWFIHESELTLRPFIHKYSTLCYSLTEKSQTL